MTAFLCRFLLGDIVLEASIMFRMLSSSEVLGAMMSCLVVASEWLDSQSVNLVLDFTLVSFSSSSFFLCD
jgi:hypothetical protein